MKVSFTEYTVVKGSPIILKCAVTSEPQHSRVYWQRKDGSARFYAGQLGIGGSTVLDPSLEINETTVSMTGEYICIAENEIGAGRSSPVLLTGLIKHFYLIVLFSYFTRFNSFFTLLENE